MLGFPLGVLSAAGAGGGATGPAYELISTTVLGSNTGSVTFSSLGDYASTYKHLQIRYVARTSRGEINDAMNIQLNGDTTSSNYKNHYLYGTGSTVASGNASGGFNSPLAGNTATANAFAVGVVDIVDAFSSTKNTTLRGLGGVSSSFNQIMLNSGLWVNTASITSIALLSGNGANLVTGTRISLYGIR